MFPFTINALLSTIGFAWSMRALSLLVFFIGFLGNVGMKPRVPLPPVTSAGQSSHRPPPLRNHVDHQVFRSPLYLAVVRDYVMLVKIRSRSQHLTGSNYYDTSHGVLSRSVLHFLVRVRYRLVDYRWHSGPGRVQSCHNVGSVSLCCRHCLL